MSLEVPLSRPDPDEPFGSGLLLGPRLGAGATGEVRRATVRATGEQVAVKLLRPDLASDPVLVARFLQEADVLRRLEHPHLVRLRDVVLEGGRLGLVVDLVDGGDLRRRLQEAGRLAPAEAAGLAAQVAAALTAVHAAGVTHRDVKPANVLLDRNGAARLADLGVARLASAPELTRHSGVIGTPDYLAPEASEGEAGPASDVYALGVVLHELLAGQVPFRATHPVAVLRLHLEAAPPVLPVPAPLAELLGAMLAKDPSARPTAAQAEQRLRALQRDLAAVPALAAAPVASTTESASAQTHVRPRPAAPAEPEPPAVRRRRPLLVAAAAVTALALAAGAALLVLRDEPDELDLAGSRTTPGPSASAQAGPPLAALPEAPAGTEPVDGELLPPAGAPVDGAPPQPAVVAAPGAAPAAPARGVGPGAVPPAGAPASSAPAPAPAPAQTAAPAPAAEQSSAPPPPPPPPPTQPPGLPSGSPGCSGTASTSVNGATVETVSCIRYITSSTGKQLVQGDTYAREVPGSTHNSYGRFRVWVQLRRADGSFLAENICEVTSAFDQPTSDPYWTQCGRAADTAGAGMYSVGFVRGERPFVQTDPGRMSKSPPL